MLEEIPIAIAAGIVGMLSVLWVPLRQQSGQRYIYLANAMLANAMSDTPTPYQYDR